MKNIAIIAGSSSLKPWFPTTEILIKTPFDKKIVSLQKGYFANQNIYYLPRHGRENNIPAHNINYRANIWALQKQNIKHIFAINTTGGININPLSVVVPNQIIDYTYNRKNTFFDNKIHHVDFSYPFSQTLRKKILISNKEIITQKSSTIAVTNGPRLETAAEVLKFKNDGCHIVGMTTMPEAVLAREIKIKYATIAIVVNYAAGIANKSIDIKEVKINNKKATKIISKILFNTLKNDS
jgi:5'-methylthioinosine phosphorylase